MAKYAGYVKVYSGVHGAGRDVYVQNHCHKAFERVLRDYRSDYNMMSIFRIVCLLNADTSQGRSINFAGSVRKIRRGNIAMQYELANGKVFIHQLIISRHTPNPKSGLYKVSYSADRGGWLAGNDVEKAIDKKTQWKSKSVKACYAAVAGNFDSKDQAGRLLIGHIVGAYQKEDFLTSDEAKDAYWMFWSEKRHHKKPESAQALASVIQQNRTNGVPVNWLVHHSGTETFKNAVKQLGNAPNSANSPAQNVYFSNPSSGDANSLKKLCESAGFNYVGLNDNHRDLLRGSALKAGSKSIATLGILNYATTGTLDPLAGLKLIGAAGIEKVAANANTFWNNSNYLGVAVTMMATGIIVLGVASTSKPIRAGIMCTIGKGNQKWFEGDASLLG